MKLPAVERYWAAELGCTPADLHSPRVTVVSHAHDYQGLLLLRRVDGCVVSAPGAWLEHVRQLFQGSDPDQAFDPAWIRSALGDHVSRIIGPAFLGYLESPRPVGPPAGIRPLGPPDRPHLERVQALCSAEEWEHSGVKVDHPDLLGLFAGDELAAVGVMQTWGAGLLHLGLLTHPAHRGCGHGSRMGAALCAESFRRGKIPQYRALLTNGPSLAVARRLGFEEWGQSLAVRLTSMRKEEACG